MNTFALQLILQDILPNLYPDLDSTRRFLHRTGLLQTRIPLTDTATNTWYYILREAQHQHKLLPLVETALIDYPHDHTLHAIHSYLVSTKCGLETTNQP